MRNISPYLRLMRLHQPTGIWLLLWPCLWSITLATDGRPPLAMLALYAIGAVVMRSAGCIVNDIWDRKFDSQVERTKNRPLASGELNLTQALLLMAFLLIGGLAIALQLGKPTVIFAACALPLVASYPLMKRITWWPQLFLGLTFNWGALMGWVSVRGEVELPALILYAGCIFWTLAYDTIYAHQDVTDDARIGVKSTARKLGARTKPFVAICYGVFATLFATALMEASRLGIFSALIIIAGLGLIFYSLYTLKLTDREACKRFFAFNTRIAIVFFIAIVVG